MINYAIKDKNKIVNVILAETKEIAEEVTGLEAIEVTEEQPLGIDWELIDNVWTVPEHLVVSSLSEEIVIENPEEIVIENPEEV